MYVFQLPCWKNVPSLLFKVLTAHFQADSGNDFAPSTPAFMYVLLLYRKPAGGSSRHTRQQKDQKHVNNGCPEPVHNSDGCPVRRPGRRRGVQRHREAEHCEGETALGGHASPVDLCGRRVFSSAACVPGEAVERRRDYGRCARLNRGGGRSREGERGAGGGGK